MTNYKERSAKSQVSLPLFIPGDQGWLNPQPNPELVQAHTEPNGVKTKDLQQYLGISLADLRKCRAGVAMSWKAYLLCHLGRNRWAVYKQYTLKGYRA